VAALVAGLAIGVAVGWQHWDQSSTISALRTSLATAHRRENGLAARLVTQTKRLAATTSALNLARLDQPMPACPHLTYGADGSVGPIACTVVNPPALAWAKKIAPNLFQLGPNAAPAQVTAAVQAGGTLPIDCELYQMAQLLRNWQFGIQVVSYCTNLQRTQS
jgi:hypothetical protein